jgi:hypothetical protein
MTQKKPEWQKMLADIQNTSVPAALRCIRENARFMKGRSQICQPVESACYREVEKAATEKLTTLGAPLND